MIAETPLWATYLTIGFSAVTIVCSIATMIILGRR